MPRKRYTAEQIITKFRQAEVEIARGQPVAEVCRKLSTSEQTHYRAGYSPRTAPQQGSRLLKNVHVRAAIAAKQTQQLAAVEVRVEDVLRDLQAITHTDLQTLAAQSGVQLGDL